MDPDNSDEAYQERILPHVSRTFALTIPQLPPALRTAVTNAYLLCRIADTIEDEPALSADASLVLLQRFVAVTYGREDPSLLARELVPQLSDRTLASERDLVLHMEPVIRVTAGLAEHQRSAIRRCVEVMCTGMHQFQRTASLRGLPRLGDLDEYCYYVAGVVGQMLTELFCGYSPKIMRQRVAMHDLALSFAQGLQMTNILKDVWEDRSRGACWLPRDVFARHGIDLAQLTAQQADARFTAAMHELVGVAHAHLRNALSYTLLIPGEEQGIRRFCLWAIGLAVLTLRRIERTPGFTAGSQVKISRRAVAVTRTLTSLAVRRDWVLRALFERAASGLPLATLSSARHPSRRYPDLPSATLEYEQAPAPAAAVRARRASEGRSTG